MPVSHGGYHNSGIGDKTMMDALIPAVDAAQKADDDIMAILKAAKEAAVRGQRKANSTYPGTEGPEAIRSRP